MSEMNGYLKEDIDELEKLKKKIPNDREFSIELINYKEQLMLFLKWMVLLMQAKWLI